MLGIGMAKSGQGEKGLPLASEAVEALERLVDFGRKDCEHFLALALINRAKIYMVTKQWTRALIDCDRSIFIYRCLVEEAGPHFYAALAHAQCTRAAVRYELGDRSGSEQDRREGFSNLRGLIHEWGCESEITAVFLRDSIRALGYLLAANSKEIRIVLEGVLRECEKAFSTERSCEALRLEAKRAITIMGTWISQLDELGYSTLEVKTLLDKVNLLD
jgi:hypothetical protein